MNIFKPARLFRNRHLQSIAASVKLRRPLVRKRARALLRQSREVLVDGGDGVRLQGFYSSHRDRPRDLVILLHGWEGSSDSMYLLSSAGHLFNRGFDVFRLNMRDHGTSHHLNQGLFNSCLIDEVLYAVGRIKAEYTDGQKTFLCGFSLGGNFALRIAARAPQAGFTLDRVAAICPVLHPPATMDALANGFFVYNTYFIRKWKKSLLKKKALFPAIYDFDDPNVFKSLGTMTDYFVTRYTHFEDADTYLNGYSLTGDALSDLTIPAHIISSLDDPVIPYQDLERLARPSSLSVTLTPFGGHCGFITGPSMKSWVDGVLADLFSGEIA